LEFTLKDRNTSAHFCAQKGHLPCLKLILGKDESLATRLNEASQTPLHIATLNGNVDVVKYLLPLTKNVKKSADELWNIAIRNRDAEMLNLFLEDLCSEKQIPNGLFGREIIIEYKLQDARGDLVNYLSVKEEISLYELEKLVYTKSGRWLILEQRLESGRSQIRDDDDLARVLQHANVEQKNKLKEGDKVKISLQCSVNLENRPISQPRATVSAKQATKLGGLISDATLVKDTKNITSEQFAQIKSMFSEGMQNLKKDFTRDLKKVSNQTKFVSQQSSDIYEEIQQVKATDREFIKNAL